ncbi:glutamine synthetase family protein [Mycolicibacterium komossense]|uniref:Glutamine synthetase n=1 Tax=Mycolicibacterium komossense TaxID=1779 RepID=A0ABT3CL27_9MYCO|nr:glutamine synthetase family protein [Mycolicibacterium komossense]MCV7230162.1 glutamine synthetase [Mycolicibacterium komossense]
MAESVAMTQLEIPDYDLGIRGKVVRTNKTRQPTSLAMCTIVYGLSIVDEVTDTPFSSAANGYPDARLIPDESTRVALGWRPGTDAVIADLVGADGTPIEMSPRNTLQRLLTGYDELDLQPVLGFEYELWLFQGAPGGPGTRLPFGTTENAYSLTRSAEVHSLATEFIDRMESVGITVEMFHSELGPGFFEFTLAPAPALTATDHAVRARQYLRDLCAERGLHASFMAKPFADKSGAGGHVHSSLTRDGVNVFCDQPRQLSPEGRHYLAGLLAGMADVTLMLNPYVNSYKRIDPEMFTPGSAAWGHDDRSAACRVILGDIASARVEHRRPGADASPYLVAAAVLAAGLQGLREQLPLSPSSADCGALPPDLRSAVTSFESSAWLPELLGKPFCSSFAATRRAEAHRYEQWLRHTVTSWELSRHLEHQ